MLDSARLRDPNRKNPIATLAGGLPGLAFAIALAAGCTWIAAHAGRALFSMATSPVSPILVAIIVGVLLGQFRHWPAALAPGLRFAANGVLRMGIALIGLRLALVSLGALSLHAAPIVVGCLLFAALVIPRVCRWLGVNAESATLLTVGTAICGCTAVLAVAPVIRASAAQTGYAVATVMLLGLCGVVVYPFLAHYLFASAPVSAGIFLGTAIHDTSQVVGAGLVYAQQFQSPMALTAATVAKLMRNLSLAVVVPVLAWRAARVHGPTAEGGRVTRYVPWFVVGFILFAALRTVGDTMARGNPALQYRWDVLVTQVAHTADWCLTIGMFATGMTLANSGLRSLGWRPLVAGLVAAVLLAATSLSLLLAIY